METVQTKNVLKIITSITYLLMVIVNALANILPINGVNTGQVSDSYPNLFAPAGLTFSIWGLIYLLLALYTLYQIGLFQGNKKTVKFELLYKINILFSISSIANVFWIFSWHYFLIPLSMFLIVVILFCLIRMNQLTSQEQFTSKEKIFIRLPFSIYFGWITVATIANATALLVYFGWKGIGVSESIWTVLVIIIGMLIGSVTLFKNRDIAYGLVLIWAYLGIYIKHSSTSGFSNQYPAVMYTVIACIAIFIITIVYIQFSKKKGAYHS